MNNTEELITIEDSIGAHIYHPLDVVIQKGEGAWVYDVDNNKFLDCLSAYSALNQGHCHPKIRDAMIKQASELTLTSRAFRNDQLPKFYQYISELTGYEMVLPMNSGAEAVETAIKAARKWAYKVKGVPEYDAEVITCSNNFHGRTITVISFSTEEHYRKYFGPFTPGFKTVPFGDISSLENEISENTAAIMFEPIQGEAGVIVPPEGYIKKLREICDQKQILMIADEIQTGLGRTGKLFACDHENVRPDIMIVGKALSGGFYPVSAVLADREILGLFEPGEHGSTFGGNPLGAVIAKTSLEVLVDEGLIQNAENMGEYFMDHLAEMPMKHIKELRGKGLLIGIELNEKAGGARRFCEGLQEKGILAKETHENVIRFAPPLIINEEIIDWAAPKIREVLSID